MQKLCKVKTKEQIEETLDRGGRCSDVSMVQAMYRHCGETYVARPTWSTGAWVLYDKRGRPVVSDLGYAWTWVSEWLDFEATDENDLTKIIAGGRKK